MGKHRHTGWGCVRKIYPICNTLKGLIKPLVLLLISIPVIVNSNYSPLYLLDFLSSLIVSTFPSIIGFVLTGYALIIGFSSSEILTYLTKRKKNKKYSIFQIINSTFAVVIAIIIVTFLFGSICSFIQKAEISIIFSCNVDIFNYIVLVLLLFCFYYSICALLDIVINIFNLGQFANILAARKNNERKDEKC